MQLLQIHSTQITAGCEIYEGEKETHNSVMLQSSKAKSEALCADTLTIFPLFVKAAQHALWTLPMIKSRGK